MNNSLLEERCVRYNLLEYIQSLEAKVISISPKLVSLGNKEIVLMHVIIQQGEKISGTDVWPKRHISLNEISSLHTLITNISFCIYYKSGVDEYGENQMKASFPLWDSYYHNDNEMIPSGPEILYDLYNNVWSSEIYNRAYPIMPTYSFSDSILFIDTETTGLPKNPKASSNDTHNWPRLVQIAWILTDNTGKVIEEFQSIIKPIGFSIPAEATAVHKISQYDAVTRGRELQEVLYKLNSAACQSYCIVGHNISFDLNIIDAEMIRCGMENALYSKERFCTMMESTQYCGLSNSKYPTLNELYQKLFGESFSDAHDAMVDTRATMKCYWEMRRRGIHFIPENLPF